MTVASCTADDVRAIIELPASVADSTINAMIGTAVALVGQCESVLTADETLQKAIVQWVTAHFLAYRYGQDGPRTQQALGDASESFSSGSRTFGRGLAGTTYGQQALLLDASGCLAKLGKDKAQFQVL